MRISFSRVFTYFFSAVVIVFFGRSDAHGEKKRRDVWDILKEIEVVDDTTKVNLYHAVFWHYAVANDDSAIYYADKGMMLAQRVGFKRGEASHLKNIGYYFNELVKDQKTAIPILLQAARKYDEIEYESGKTILYAYLSIAYLRAGDKHNGEFYRKKAVVYHQLYEQEPLQEAYFHMFCGVAYAKAFQMYDSAISSFQTALEMFIVEKQSHGLFYTQLILAQAYKQQGFYAEAESLLLRLIADRSCAKYPTVLSDAYVGLVEMYIGLQRFEEAKKHLLSYDLAADTLGNHVRRSNAKSWYEYYEAVGDNKNAVKKLKQYAFLQDSSIISRYKKTLEKQKAAFDVLNQHKTIVSLTQDNKRKKEEIKEVRQHNIGLIVMVCLVASLLILAMWAYQRKDRLSKLIREQKWTIEEQNKQLETHLNILSAKNQELEKANKAWEKAIDENKYIIDMVAHDIRSPLSRIQGLVNVFKLSNGSLSIDDVSILDKVNDNIESLKRMTSRILNANTLESADVKLNNEQVDLDKLIRRTLVGWREQSLSKHIELDYINKIGEALSLETDKGLLQQVLENLVSNAVKYSERDSTVTVYLSKTDESVLVEVKDQGMGILPEEMPLLFKKYQRLSNKPTAGEPSTGLGLSIAKTVMEVLGGGISCESEVGKGSVFKITLPLVTMEKA